MKAVILIAVLLCSISAMPQGFQIGAKAGINISNFTGGDFNDVEKNALVGYHIGGFIRFKFNKIAIQPELVLSSQGAKLESAGTSSNFKMTYLNIPVMVQYETDGGFYLEAGPQVGFKVDENVPDSTVGDFAKSNDLSICFGLGYHGRSGFGIGARYNIGVSKVGEFDSANISPDFKNGVLQISLFFTIFNNRKSQPQ